MAKSPAHAREDPWLPSHTSPELVGEEASWARTEWSDVALENARLSQPGQAFAHGTGASLTDALDGHEVLEVGGEQLLEAAEMVDQAFDDGAGESGNLGEQSVATGADRCVEGIAADDESHRFGARGKVEKLDRGELHQVAQDLDDGVTVGCGIEVVADHELTVVAQATGQLFELKREQAPVGAKLDDVAVDLLLDPPDHLEATEHSGHIADRDEILDLQR